MPRNGSGVYSRTQPDYVFGTVIDETAINSEYNDIGNEITNSIAADGQTTPTGNMPMGGFRHLVVASAQNRNEYGTAAQVQDGSLIYAEDTGTPDAYVISPSPAVTTQQAGRVWRVKIKPGNTNTGACTLKVNALSPVAIKTFSGDDPVAGSLEQGQIYEFTDSGPGGSYLIATVADIPDGSVTENKLADNAVTNVKIADNAVNTAEIVDAAVTLPKQAAGTQGGLIYYAGAGGAPTDSGAGTLGHVWTAQGAGQDSIWAAPQGGKYAAVASIAIASVTNSATVPDDDTPPTVTEGTEVASVTLTPTTATQRVKVTVSFMLDADGNMGLATSVFSGSTNIGTQEVQLAASTPQSLSIVVDDAPATTSPVTYSVRCGKRGGAGTNWRVNRLNVGNKYGGALQLTRLYAEAYEP